MQIVAIFLAVAVATVYGAEICCPGLECFNDNPPFSHLPLPQCLDIVKPNFNMFTRENRNNGQTVSPTSIPNVFKSNRRTIFVVHGFWNNQYTEWLHMMKNKFLTKGDYNIVVVGWGGGSTNLWYPQSAANVRTAGAQIAKIAAALVARGLSTSNLYCVGHSLGGHTCGHAGKRQTFGRITGMDPAGPEFDEFANAAGLYRTDANFVDVIHSMGKEGFIMDFGTLKPLGHVDFYPNGGGIQPGCENLMNAEAKGEIGCSHGRAVEFMDESINTDCFKARHTCSNENNIPGSCSSCGANGCTTMGFGAESSSTRGRVYLETNAAGPFCKN